MSTSNNMSFVWLASSFKLFTSADDSRCFHRNNSKVIFTPGSLLGSVVPSLDKVVYFEDILLSNDGFYLLSQQEAKKPSRVEFKSHRTNRNAEHKE